jgi:AcrR family transcriptional regulator
MDAALRLAASGEADAVSVRKLGAELAADPTAIYRLFRGKDELVLALMDRLLSQSVASLPREGDWRQHLADCAQATLDTFVAHPALGLELGSRSTGGPGKRDVIEMVLADLHDAGPGRRRDRSLLRGLHQLRPVVHQCDLRRPDR